MQLRVILYNAGGEMRLPLILFIGVCVMVSTAFAVSQPPVDNHPAVWLERKADRYGGEIKKHGKKGAAKHQKGSKTGETEKPQEKHGEHPQEGQKEKTGKKKKRRSPMSRPAAYFIKSGAFPHAISEPAELLESICWIKMPDQTYKQISPKKTDQGILVYDEALQAGFYQVHLYHHAGVVQDRRHHHFSTIWFRNPGEDEFEVQPYIEEEREGLHGKEPVFYLKELTVDAGNNYVSQKRYTGDELPVQVLFKGVPVVGAQVTLTTTKGWQKSVLTDADGKATLMLIKEVFHNDRVHRETQPYLVKATYEVANSGTYDDKAFSTEVYTATSRLMIYPTPYDWKSKSAGFYIFAASAFTVSFAAAIRRKRSRSI